MYLFNTTFNSMLNLVLNLLVTHHFLRCISTSSKVDLGNIVITIFYLYSIFFFSYNFRRSIEPPSAPCKTPRRTSPKLAELVRRRVEGNTCIVAFLERKRMGFDNRYHPRIERRQLPLCQRNALSWGQRASSGEGPTLTNHPPPISSVRRTHSTLC